MLSKARPSIATNSKNLATLVNHELRRRHGMKVKLVLILKYVDAMDWCMKALHIVCDSHCGSPLILFKDRTVARVESGCSSRRRIHQTREELVLTLSIRTQETV